MTTTDTRFKVWGVAEPMPALFAAMGWTRKHDRPSASWETTDGITVMFDYERGDTWGNSRRTGYTWLKLYYTRPGTYITNNRRVAISEGGYLDLTKIPAKYAGLVAELARDTELATRAATTKDAEVAWQTAQTEAVLSRFGVETAGVEHRGNTIRVTLTMTPEQFAKFLEVEA